MEGMMARILTYAEKDTWIHRLSGVTKLLFFLVWSVVGMLTYDTRVLFDQYRHGSGRRRHPAGQRQLDLGLRAPGARLPGGQPHDLLEQRATGRPRARGRLRHPVRLQGRGHSRYWNFLRSF